ncbi:MAG TPA: NAD(P)H-binding protein [Anaerolineales bacterium]|nr:NAD(P)H-binding protein [Anaerolineales bacterium]
MTSPLILVTGATGYIASRLIPRLLDLGYNVRALARDPRRLAARSWFDKIEVIQADVTTPSTLARALDGVDTAYYLIHNMSRGYGYTSLELNAARNFAQAAEQAGVKHIIYLGGLADPEQHIAPHLRSRIETGKVLREGKVPVTEFRAGVIAGSRSISFEMIRFMTELLPIVPGPLWMNNKTQPIAIQNIIDYLVVALENKSGQGKVFEIGGPDIMAYKDTMLRYARMRELSRRTVLLPGIPVWFMAFGVHLMTPVPYPIAHALIGGLAADSVVKHPEALKVFPEVKLIDFDTATRDALEKTHPSHIERVWDVPGDFGSLSEDDPNRNDSRKMSPSRASRRHGDASEVWSTLKHEGCFIDHRMMKVNSSPESVFQAVMKIISKYGWHVEEEEKNCRSLVRDTGRRFGNWWVDWRVVRHAGREACPKGGSVTYISQTVFFSPHGLPGFLYWILLYPSHCSRFRGLIRGIVRQSQSS